jgi:tetratricopeptide (TPR) repeat protein
MRNMTVCSIRNPRTRRTPGDGILFAATFALALAGCAAGQPKDEPRREGAVSASTAIEESIKVDAAARADFEAALALLNDGKFDQGIELLNRVVQRAPASSAPYINLAIAQQNTGKLEAAEENLKKALAISPGHPVASNEYGILYRRTGRFAEARKTYEDTLTKHPAFLPARKNLAILCDVYMKDYECALENYQKYSEATPGDKTVETWIADVRTRAGR